MAANIAVVGSANASPAERDLAFQVGELIADNAAVLVCGGRSGVMEAACEGAFRAGGLTVGLLPGSDRSKANRFLTVVLPTGLGEMRNALIIRSVDVVIAIGGSWGTLSELAIAKIRGTPVVLLRSWDLQSRAEGEEDQLGARASTPVEAINLALEAITPDRGL